MIDNKKKSFRQLKKQSENGRELIHRLAGRCNYYEKVIESLKAQLQSSQAFLGLAIERNAEGRSVIDLTPQIRVQKDELTSFISTKSMEWQETEDKTAFIITVKEAPKYDEVEETTEASEGGEVQQPQDDSGRDNVYECEGSNEVQGTQADGEGEADNGLDTTTEV